MAKRGLTTERVIERERAAFEMFQKDSKITAKAVRALLKKKLKFGMRLQRLYELKRAAASGKDYSPRERRGGTERRDTERRDSIERRTTPVVQAPRKGHRMAQSPDFAEHPAVQEARRVLEEAGFRHISIDAYLPMHYSQAPLAATA